ncbi:fumarylacetoacetase [Povalibacter sp.]|uniref:fumarylacetoacetase n=1 Tax=Povalibacter sp. TaxID=1962978 RepID=UPI002F3F6ECA
MNPALDETHDPGAVSWVESAANHLDFPVQNLPLGLFSLARDSRRRAGIAIGDRILALDRTAPLLEGDARRAAQSCESGTLNALLALGAAPRRALRRAIFKLLTDRQYASEVSSALSPASDCELHVPANVGDYTDFYTGIHHATNIGRLFRPDNPLLPNYKYVPIGYHGRSSSIVASGTRVIRPTAQIKAAADAAPSYQPTQRLDYELELGIWIGGENPRGEPIAIARAEDYVAGLCLLNDWSARDVQAWEYQPLGPFLAKNFLTTVSPWIVTSEALAPYRIAQPPRPDGDPAPLPYLLDATNQATGAYAVTMEVHLQTAQMRAAGIAPQRLSRGPMSVMYWTVAQLVAHHTCNGCNLRPGDLLGTGTLSGPDATSLGCLMEISSGGRTPIELPGGEQRTFLQEGDRLVMTAYAEAPGRARIGFGECAGEVVSPSEPSS